ncbi:nuclear transport factor 2 family protein [Nonomuraea sp. NPDC000554]|uniref:YybH family protein n=1 Tax=Nonomuraea sp. NPDC000554 TaxID=3154259 RepID=UPI00332EEEEC
MTSPDDRASLLDHDRRFFDALVAADLATLDALLADDFLLVGVGDGAVATRADLLGLMAAGTLRFPAIHSYPDEAVVRRAGDVGIVVGRTGMDFTGPDGATFTAGSRYTHVFAATPGAGWRLLSAQGTEIKPAA